MKKHTIDRQRWLIILAGALICGGVQGAVLNTLSIFIKPTSEALGFSRGEFSAYQGVITITAMLSLPIYGELYRKPWMKKVTVASAFVCALVPLGFSLSTQLWQFYALAVIFGAFLNGVSMSSVANMINYWFGRNKGLAIGLAYGGSGVFASMTVSLANYAINAYGWQWGYRAVFLVSALMTIPTAIFLVRVRPKPGEYGEHDPEFDYEADGKHEYHVEMTRKEAMRTGTFYLMFIGASLSSICLQATSHNSVAYLSDLGYSVAIQSMVASVSMFLMTFTKIAVGRIIDRCGVKFTIAINGIAIVLCGSTLLLSQVWKFAPYILAVSISILGGLSSVTTNCMTSIYFGRKEFGRIYALMSLFGNVGMAIGIPLPGTVYDHFGTYIPAWYGVLALAGLVVLNHGAAYAGHLKRVKNLQKQSGQCA